MIAGALGWWVALAALPASSAPAPDVAPDVAPYVFPAPRVCQRTTAWCWAAVTEMTVRGFQAQGVPFPVEPTQCQMAIDAHGPGGRGTGLYCDCDGELEIRSDAVVTGWPALAAFGLDCERTAEGEALSFAQLSSEIETHHRPVVFSWEYPPGGNGHIMLAVAAYRTGSGAEVVLVNDPADPVCQVEPEGCRGGRVCLMGYDDYVQSSSGRGTWSYWHWYDFFGIGAAGGALATCAPPEEGAGGGGPPPPPRRPPGAARPSAERVRAWTSDLLRSGGEAVRGALGVSGAAAEVEVNATPVAVRRVDRTDLHPRALGAGGQVWTRPVDGWRRRVRVGGRSLVVEERPREGAVVPAMLCADEGELAALDRAGELAGREGLPARAVERVELPELDLRLLAYPLGDGRRALVDDRHPGLAVEAVALVEQLLREPGAAREPRQLLTRLRALLAGHAADPGRARR